MAIDYVSLLDGHQIKNGRDGKAIADPRMYDEQDKSTVEADLPETNDPHPTEAGLYLSNYTIESVPAKEKTRVVLNWAPRRASSTSNFRPSANSAGETWEWLMVSQMTRITSAPKQDGQFPVRELRQVRQQFASLRAEPRSS